MVICNGQWQPNKQKIASPSAVKVWVSPPGKERRPVTVPAEHEESGMVVWDNQSWLQDQMQEWGCSLLYPPVSFKSFSEIEAGSPREGVSGLTGFMSLLKASCSHSNVSQILIWDSIQGKSACLWVSRPLTLTSPLSYDQPCLGSS